MPRSPTKSSYSRKRSRLEAATVLGVIVGIGFELCSIQRVRSALAHYGPRFAHRVCHELEWADLRESDPAPSLSARLAVKRAFRRALAECHAMHWRDVYVLREANGKPRLVLSEASTARVRAAGANRWHVSIAHEADVAAALIVLERAT